MDHCKIHLPFFVQMAIILEYYDLLEFKKKKWNKIWMICKASKKCLCENLDVENFISESYAQSKSDGKYYENRHFRIWFLENSKKIQKILQKKIIFFYLKILLFNHFQLWEKKIVFLHLLKGSALWVHLEGG